MSQKVPSSIWAWISSAGLGFAVRCSVLCSLQVNQVDTPFPYNMLCFAACVGTAAWLCDAFLLFLWLCADSGSVRVAVAGKQASAHRMCAGVWTPGACASPG